MPRAAMPDAVAPDAALPDLAMLATGRVHEATGRGRLAFALALAGRLTGPVVWIADAGGRDALYAPGLAVFLDPARLILARPSGALAVLQTAEEALRAGAAPLVVAELAAAPDLTASRRLQLAAGTGGGRGLCLVPEARLCTNAAETRWRCQPVPGRDDARQHWEVVKSKRGRLGHWQVALRDGRFVAAAPAPAGLRRVPDGQPVEVSGQVRDDPSTGSGR